MIRVRMGARSSAPSADAHPLRPGALCSLGASAALTLALMGCDPRPKEPTMPERVSPMMDPRVQGAVFFPRPDLACGPEAMKARDVHFEVSPGVALRLRVFPGDPAAPNILFFHGNGETARDYDSLADKYRDLPATLAVAEYRGYGSSTGSPSLDTLLPDAHRTLAAYRSLLDSEGRHGPLIVMGRSLGSAPAIELASSREARVDGLIVESGFARMLPLLELLGVPAGRMGITEEQGPRNRDKMATIALPTLILHAENDEIIPMADAEQLFTACQDPGKAFLRVAHAGHNDIQARAGSSYFKAVRELLARVQAGRAAP